MRLSSGSGQLQLSSAIGATADSCSHELHRVHGSTAATNGGSMSAVAVGCALSQSTAVPNEILDAMHSSKSTKGHYPHAQKQPLHGGGSSDFLRTSIIWGIVMPTALLMFVFVALYAALGPGIRVAPMTTAMMPPPVDAAIGAA